MTTATLDRTARPGRTERGYGFRTVAQMEWLKLRSVRSTWWTLLVFAAGMIGLAILVMTHQHWATMSAADRASFAAAPRRPLVLAAKAAIVAAVTLVAGEILAFVAFGIGEAVLKNPAPHASLGQPGVLRAVLMAGAYPALIALIG